MIHSVDARRSFLVGWVKEEHSYGHTRYSSVHPQNHQESDWSTVNSLTKFVLDLFIHSSHDRRANSNNLFAAFHFPLPVIVKFITRRDHFNPRYVSVL